MPDQKPPSRLTEDELDKVTVQVERAAKSQLLEGVRGSSFIDSPTLCNTCRWATIYRQASKNNRVIHCVQLDRDIPDDITECNEYRNLTTLTLGQMVEIATLIDNRKERNSGYL